MLHKMVTTRARVACGAAFATLLLAGTALPASASSSNSYTPTNWVSDQKGVAPIQDPNLVNAWGLAYGPTTPLWVADNAMSVSTLYTGGNGKAAVSKVPLTVTIPSEDPTGQVFNPTGSFTIRSGTAHAAAKFIFATESGGIVGWNPQVPKPMPPATASTMGVTAVSVPNAVYKGLALVETAKGRFLYATNFHNGTVDIFNTVFHQLHWKGAFVDPTIPAGYAPFNIQYLEGRVYVTYAKQDAAKHDDDHGPHRGYLDVYDIYGKLIKRLASQGPLDSPWGLAISPSNFGPFSRDLLVGNFGDGHISAFDRHSGAFLGQLEMPNHLPVIIDGLWGLKFGNGTVGTPWTLLFSAGPDGEAHGLLGAITAG
jgi:uncharacterized protein (TIGR03118 family)